jgi:hypothetical protein
MTVRQGGGGEDAGLLNGISGPAALFALSPTEAAQFRNIAGVRTAPSGGAQQGYLAGVGRLAISERTTLRVNYIGDAYDGTNPGGAAGEARLSTRISDFTLGLSETINHGFESAWTGYGKSQALNASDAWASWNVFSNFSVGSGLRRALRLDGTETTELNLSQSLGLGGGWISNSTQTGLDHDGGTTGSLSYSNRIFGSYGLNAGIDYQSGTRFQATGAYVGTQGPISNKWSMYATASQPLSTPSPARFDGGITGDFHGLTTTAYGGVAMDGTGYIGVSLRVPLSPSPQRDRWLGF